MRRGGGRGSREGLSTGGKRNGGEITGGMSVLVVEEVVKVVMRYLEGKA